MKIEERRVVAKPSVALEDIPLDKNDPEKYTRGWSKYGKEDKARSCPILKEEH